jgi:hypothetical protein
MPVVLGSDGAKVVELSAKLGRGSSSSAQLIRIRIPPARTRPTKSGEWIFAGRDDTAAGLLSLHFDGRCLGKEAARRTPKGQGEERLLLRVFRG